MLKLSIILPLLLWIGTDQEKLVKTKITDDISLSLPENFFPMSPQDLARHFPSVRKPVGAYTNESRQVNFNINISATRWRSQDAEIAKEFFKASLFNLFDKVNIIQEGIKTINKKDFIVFEFESRINGEQFSLDTSEPVRTYSYMQYLIINGKTLVFSFSCPIQLKEKWQSIVPEIMNSIKVSNSIE